MNKEQQIGEMAKDIPFLTLERTVFVSLDRKQKHAWMLSEEDTIAIAEALYNAGYRKVLLETENGYEVDCPQYAPWELVKGHTEREVNKARKETAKEIRDKIITNKDMPEPIKNEWKKWFNKEYGVEIEE